MTILIFANYELAGQAVTLIVLCMYFLFIFQTYTLVHIQPLLELTPKGLTKWSWLGWDLKVFSLLRFQVHLAPRLREGLEGVVRGARNLPGHPALPPKKKKKTGVGIPFYLLF